jgi:hypothetical protein
MVFSLVNPGRSSPDEYFFPQKNLISGLLGGYKNAVGAQYAKPMLEADIFAKKIGPLATLATSPMFLQNPQFQAALGRLIANGLGGAGQGFGGMNVGNESTYADQFTKEIDAAEKDAQDLTKAGKAQTGASSLAGYIQNIFGDRGKQVFDALTGGNVTSELAQKENSLEDSLARLKKVALDTQQVNSSDADTIFKRHGNETPKQTLARVKKRFPNLVREGNINRAEIENPNSLQQAQETHEDMEAINEAASRFKTTPEIVRQAQALGIKNANDMREFLRNQ